MIAALLILSFYSVVAGWSLDYIIGMGRGEFVGIDGEGAGARFGALTGDPLRLGLWHTLFMLVTAFIIGRGGGCYVRLPRIGLLGHFLVLPLANAME